MSLQVDNWLISLAVKSFFFFFNFVDKDNQLLIIYWPYIVNILMYRQKKYISFEIVPPYDLKTLQTRDPSIHHQVNTLLTSGNHPIIYSSVKGTTPPFRKYHIFEGQWKSDRPSTVGRQIDYSRDLKLVRSCLFSKNQSGFSRKIFLAGLKH